MKKRVSHSIYIISIVFLENACVVVVVVVVVVVNECVKLWYGSAFLMLHYTISFTHHTTYQI